MTEHYDVIIIGGGQAGLSMGYHLSRTGRRFVILDAAPRVGHSWRTRWESLTLFTPGRFSALPGLPFPGDPDHYPGKNEVADYLEQYAAAFDLPIRFDQEVRSLRPPESGAGYEVETATTVYRADEVVVATGPFQRGAVPPVAAQLDARIPQLHSSHYQSPAQLRQGEVLVVGAGNSGVQIAAEIAGTHPVVLSMGERQARLPQRLLGRSIFWWLEETGLMNVPVTSRLGARASRREFLIGTSPDMLARSHDIRLVGRVASASGERVGTADGASLRPSAIIWATGFRSDYAWIEAAIFDRRGHPIQNRGVTSLPGLYFLGLPWQYTRGSALIGWVGRDAEYLAERIGRTQVVVPVTGSVTVGAIR